MSEVSFEEFTGSKDSGAPAAKPKGSGTMSFEEFAKPQESGGVVKGLAEGAASFVTGIPGGIASSIAGPLSRAAGKPEIGRAVEEAGRAITYEPKTAAGKKTAEIISWPFEKLSEGVSWIGDKLGDTVARAAPSQGLSPEVAAQLRDHAKQIGSGAGELVTNLALMGVPLKFTKGKTGKPVVEPKSIETAFDDLAKKNPAQAKELAAKVEDKETSKALTQRVEELEKIQVKEVSMEEFEQARKAIEKPKTDTPPADRRREPRMGEADALRHAREQRLAAEAVTPEQASSGVRNAVAQAHVEINGSGESVASLEAINRQQSEKSKGQGRYALDVMSGEAKPLIGPEAVDARAQPRQVIIQKGVGKDTWTVLDSHKDLNPAQIKSALARFEQQDPVVFMNMGIPVTKKTLENAFGKLRSGLQKVEGYDRAEANVKYSVEQALNVLSPESRGPKAKSTAALLASNIAKMKRDENIFYNKSEPRRLFWSARAGEAKEFLRKSERGEPFSDPLLNQAANGYRAAYKAILDEDLKKGLDIEPVDNYIYHLVDRPKEAEAFLANKYGPKWGDPVFMNQRNARYITDLEKAGFKLRTYNPEELLQARRHASKIAHMKIDQLREMESWGLARRIGKGDKASPLEHMWRSPNGELYALGDEAHGIMNAHFNTPRLWNMRGLVGEGFRASMWLKNRIIPFKLASLFHPVHTAMMTTASSMVNATKAVAAGKTSVTAGMLELAAQHLQKDVVKAGINIPGLQESQGGRSLNVLRGKVPDAQLTSIDRQRLAYQLEGGFMGDLAPEFKANALKNLSDAIASQSKLAKLKIPFQLPYAILEKVYTKPIFEEWIPRIKTFAYDTGVQKVLDGNPDLLLPENALKRQEAFRRLQKQVDARFGEMQYNTLFMNNIVKDVGIGSLLSFGWQKGFIDTYGGAVKELGKSIVSEDKLGEQIKKGDLDNSLFVLFYTEQSLFLGGLLSYALSGAYPTLKDMIYPRSGGKEANGEPSRLTTPFYDREFASLYYHSRNEGMLSGLGTVAKNKLVPTIGAMNAVFTNLDNWGHEISDPNADALTRLAQRAKFIIGDMEPVFLSSTKSQGKTSGKDIGLAFGGFSPAPRYAMKSETEAHISSLYDKYHRTSAVPFEKAETSKDRADLRRAYLADDATAYNEAAERLQNNHDLSGKEMRSIEKGLNTDSTMTMFKALTPDQQRQVLRKMTPEEREEFLPKAHKKVRQTWED